MWIHIYEDFSQRWFEDIGLYFDNSCYMNRVDAGIAKRCLLFYVYYLLTSLVLERYCTYKDINKHSKLKFFGYINSIFPWTKKRLSVIFVIYVEMHAWGFDL